jgi:predicted  nucleic acid-binding Zn-ribbon protein
MCRQAATMGMLVQDLNNLRAEQARVDVIKAQRETAERLARRLKLEVQNLEAENKTLKQDIKKMNKLYITQEQTFN